MDLSERIILIVIAIIATFLTSFEFITWEYKNHVLTGIGAILFLFILWTLMSEIIHQYKVMRK